MNERRNKIVQWMLNQGSGIVDVPEMCFLKETTEKEQLEHPFGNVRYVYSIVASYFENEVQFPEQVDYAVETDMDMQDFDEWQAIQEILFGEKPVKAMKPECAQAINTALWEYHDISPCDVLERYDGLFAELKEENQKLKWMLKEVADDAEGLFMGFVGYNPYEKRLEHEDCEAREYCDYCDRDCDCDGSQCKWRYEDNVKKLLKTKEK